MRAWKESVVGKLTGGLGLLSKQHNITHIQGKAEFVDSNTLRIQRLLGEELLHFEQAILASGSHPTVIPQFPLNTPRIMDSSAGLALQDVPNSLLVIGGGYIGLELGSVYASLGSQVTVVEMTPGLLPGVDRDLVSPLAKRLEKLFKAIFVNTTVADIKESAESLHVRFEGSAVQEPVQQFDKVLISVGRKPNSEGLGLENTKIEIDSKGFIKVDSQRRTAEKNIFAIGDIAGEPMLAHKASHEGRLAAEVIASHKVVYEPRAIPAVVFTDPEVAWCGWTETQANLQNRPIKVARFPWGASGRAATLDRTEGITKLIIDPDTEQILGMGIVGAGASELIAEGVLAVEMAATVRDLELCIHPHPTLSETVMEAAEVFFGQSTHLYRPKR